MKIFYFTSVFNPSVGGIERLAETLCAEFTALGHDVRLATLTQGSNNFPYRVIRKPSFLDFLQMLSWCDVHIQANVSLKYAYARLLAPSKILYQHNNCYRADDGSMGARDRLKRFVSHHTRGIAVSDYVARQVGCDTVIFNCYKDALFTAIAPWHSRKKDFVFVGRLVSQKGCATLLDAVGLLAKKALFPRLTVIGDGPDRVTLERRVDELGIAQQVHFRGVLEGNALASALNEHRIIVVPSVYHEPFGIVALEGLACGSIPVVSADGGLVDAIGEHGFTFRNGDHTDLAVVLAQVLAEPSLARAKIQHAEMHLARYTARNVALRYVQVFESTLMRDAASR